MIKNPYICQLNPDIAELTHIQSCNGASDVKFREKCPV